MSNKILIGVKCYTFYSCQLKATRVNSLVAFFISNSFKTKANTNHTNKTKDE